jgi:hypothetical protein
MVEYTISGESLDEIAEDLAEIGVVERQALNWGEEIAVIETVLEGARESTRQTGGEGNQQGTIQELAGLEDEYDSNEIGTILDFLDVFGYVEHNGRRYHVVDEHMD